MAGRLKYGKRVHYAHMLDDEAAVWDRFVDKFPDRFETVDYDFRVGEGMKVPEHYEENITRMAKMLSQKRIDVLAWNDDQPTIIEVKKRVGLSALGQVLGYRTLFIKNLPRIKKPKLMVLCEIISDDDMTVLKANDVPVVVV